MSSSQVAFNAAVVLQSIHNELEAQYRGEWDYAPLVGFMGEMKSSEHLNGAWPSGLGSKRPIVMVDNPFVWKGKDSKAGGNRWGRAEKQAQVDTGRSGDTSITGTGVLPDLRHSEGYVNQKRFITRIRSGHMTQQNLGAWGEAIRNDGGPELYDQANRYASSYGIRDAILRGYSRHIRGSGTGEFAVVTRWHPDLCVPGLAEGRGTASEMFTTWSATAQTPAGVDSLERRLARKVAQVTNATQFQLSRATVEKLAVIARKRLRPLKVENGKPSFALELTLNQMAQLRADPDFDAIFQNWPGGMNQQDVFFGMASAKYANFYIFDTVRGAACQIYAYDSSTAALDTLTEIAVNGTVTSANAEHLAIGPVTDAMTERNWMSLDPDDLDSAMPAGDQARYMLNLHVGIIWGEAAVYGVNCPIQGGGALVSEETDGKSIEDLILSRIFGFARVDLYDEPAPASATAVRSNRSMPFVTYSPPQGVA